MLPFALAYYANDHPTNPSLTEVAVPTRNVVLSDHQHDLVDSLVSSGRYQNASEVLREGLRLLENRELREAEKLAALRAAVQVGWDDIAAGRYIDIADDTLESYLDDLGARAAASLTE